MSPPSLHRIKIAEARSTFWGQGIQ